MPISDQLLGLLLGPLALTVGLLIAVWALATGKLERGAVSLKWQAIAETALGGLEKLTGASEAQVEVTKKLVDHVEKLDGRIDAMLEELRIEREVRQRLEGKR